MTKVVTVVIIPIKRLAHASVTKAELRRDGVAKYITRRRNDEFSRKKDEENWLFFERKKFWK